MTFENELLITIVDKLLIGILVLIVGFWFKARLERLKGQLQLGRAIAPKRASAYGELWQLTEPLSPSRPDEISLEEREKLRETLTSWYYDKGNALYLSLNASDLFLKGRRLLAKESTARAKEVTDAFSSLRTQMKVDIGVYSDKDAKVQLKAS